MTHYGDSVHYSEILGGVEEKLLIYTYLGNLETSALYELLQVSQLLFHTLSVSNLK